MPARDLLFVGTHGHVRALDKTTGHQFWDTSLPHTGYAIVTLLFEDGVLFAGSKGHLFALDAESGAILWHDGLDGLGYQHMILATARAPADSSTPVLVDQVRQQAARTAATSGGGAS